MYPQAMGADRHHTFKVLSFDARDGEVRYPLDEPVGVSAAVGGRRIYMRTHKHLFAIGEPSAS